MGTTIWSTPDVPQEIRNQLRQELLKAIATQTVKSQLAVLGMEAGNPTQTLADLEKSLQQDYEHTGQMLRAIHYKP
ncbi:hypothetical protein D3C87_2033650 [compost metagenome]